VDREEDEPMASPSSPPHPAAAAPAMPTDSRKTKNRECMVEPFLLKLAQGLGDRAGERTFVSALPPGQADRRWPGP
jgi:hypothetical protein